MSGQAGEVELHTVVCTQLLSVLVHRRHVCHILLQLQPWLDLAGTTPLQCTFIVSPFVRLARDIGGPKACVIRCNR